MVVKQLMLLCEERTLSTQVICECEKETRIIIEGADSLSSISVDFTDVKKKHTACQVRMFAYYICDWMSKQLLSTPIRTHVSMFSYFSPSVSCSNSDSYIEFLRCFCTYVYVRKICVKICTKF